MRKQAMYVITILCAVAVSCQLHAATVDKSAATPAVKVTWFNPEKYSDIRPASGTRKAYQERVTNAFDKIFVELAEKLPAGFRLEIRVTDIDLAGDVSPMYRLNNSDIRVVKDIYFPRMNFDFVLYDQNKQQVLQESDVKIKDMGFMMSSHLGSQSSEFGYEREMLKKWFNKVIVPQLMKE